MSNLALLVISIILHFLLVGQKVFMKSSTNYVGKEDMKKNVTEGIETRFQEKEAK